MAIPQVAVPGGPQRLSVEAQNRARHVVTETVQRQETLPQGPDGEQRVRQVDETRFSEELSEEVTRGAEPAANMDQMIQAISGLSESRLDGSGGTRAPKEVGETSAISGQGRKQAPKVDRVGQRQDIPQTPRVSDGGETETDRSTSRQRSTASSRVRNQNSVSQNGGGNSGGSGSSSGNSNKLEDRFELSAELQELGRSLQQRPLEGGTGSGQNNGVTEVGSARPKPTDWNQNVWARPRGRFDLHEVRG